MKPLPKWFTDQVKPWDPYMKVEKLMVIDAASFQAWIDALLPMTTDITPRDNSADHRPERFVPIGEFVLSRRRVKQWVNQSNPWGGGRTWEEIGSIPLLHQGRRFGAVSFVGEVLLPVLSRLHHYPRGTDETIWMSPSPSEVFSNRPAVRKATGRVLVGGLGMGMIAQMIKAKKGVRSITIVESRQEVIDAFGPVTLAAPGLCQDITFVCGDFYDVIKGCGPRIHATYDSVIVDIWEDYGDAVFDDEFQELKGRHEKVWGWGDYARLAA